MSLEFNLISSDKYCTYITDGTHGTHSNQVTGKYLLSAKDILDGKVHIKENSRIISENDFNKIHKNYKLENYDVLLTVAGTIGRTAIIRNYEDNYTFQRSVAIFKTNDKIKSLWLYYYLNSPIGKQIIKSLSKGTTQLILPLKDLRNLQIPVPIDSENQKSILSILVNIDKKIEINKRINKNLEQLIKYIYINWFEEFEPFKDKDFYDTKLGSIPVGWDVKPLQEFIKFQEGPGIRNWQYVEEDGINFLNIRCIQNNDLVLDTANMISKEEANGKYAHFMLNEWDLVISSSGTLGRYAIVREEHLPLCLNTSIIRFTPMHSFDHYAYVYSYLTSRGFYHYLLTMGSGSVQLNFGPTHLKQIDLIVPPENILKKYNDLIFPLIEQMVTIKSEISKLTKLRDTLLPKLMSGEIDVSKINCDLKIIIRKIYIKSSKLFLWRYLSENKNYIKNTKSNETLLKSRTIYKINKFLAKFNARYRYYRQ